MNFNLTLAEQLFILSAYSLGMFFNIRGFLYGLKLYQLNNSAYKKRKKNESLKEWFLYTRYKEEIPKIFRVYYFSNIIAHLLILILCLLFYFLKLDRKFGSTAVYFICFLDSIFWIIISLLFWSSKPGYKYSRWIKKRRGQPPKDRKK